jgi:hypothetical protein
MTVIPQLERQLATAARRRWRRNVRAATIAAVVTIALGAALLVPALLDSGGQRRAVPATPHPRPKPVGPPTSGNPPLEDLLGVFRRERTPHDKANFTMRDLKSSHDRQPGESPADSRRVDLPDGPVYLWRMKDGVCASWGNCLKTGPLAKLRVALSVGGHSASAGSRPRLVEMSGIVVDGIDQVQIGAEHSDQIVVPVKDNVFHIDLSRSDIQPTRILWREDGRWQRQDLSLP